MAFQNNAFQQNAFQSSAASGVALGARGRRLAYVPLLHAAIRNGDEVLFRGRSVLRPPVYTEHRRKTRLTSKTARSRIDTSLIGYQNAFTGGTTPGATYTSTFPTSEPTSWPSDREPV